MELIKKVVWAVLVIIVLGAIFALLFWLIDWLALPPPFGRVAHGVLVVGGVFILIFLLLDLIGYPIIKLRKDE